MSRLIARFNVLTAILELNISLDIILDIKSFSFRRFYYVIT